MDSAPKIGIPTVIGRSATFQDVQSSLGNYNPFSAQNYLNVSNAAGNSTSFNAAALTSTIK